MTTTTTVKPSCAAGHHGQAGRACSQCGVTKTPQWREGPLGPKTLCNACGVKRVRQARAALEGRSPRAGKASAASGGTKKHQSEVSTRRRAKGKSKAARAAAFILAAIEHQDSGPSTSHSEESAEEIQFFPPRPPMSPISAVVGEGGVAAFGLMSMSLPADVVQKSINAQLEAHRQRKEEKPPHKASQEEEEDAEEVQRRARLLDLRSAAEEAAKHAYAADAAVAAVAQVLALKQAIALKARAEASAAAQRVQAASAAIGKEGIPVVLPGANAV